MSRTIGVVGGSGLTVKPVCIALLYHAMVASGAAALSYGVLDDPKTRVIVGDGRHLLENHRGQFDVIVSDLFVPWESETGYLYTVEHFEAVRERLAPGGVFAQWMAAWQVGGRELDVIAESMHRVFPHVSVWLGSTSPSRTIIALVGTDGPRTLDRSVLASRFLQLAPLPVGTETVLRTSAKPSARGPRVLRDLELLSVPRRAWGIAR